MWWTLLYWRIKAHGRKYNPQFTSIKLKADRGVKKYNLRESAKSADVFKGTRWQAGASKDFSLSIYSVSFV